MPVIHGSRMALVSHGAVCLADVILILSSTLEHSVCDEAPNGGDLSAVRDHRDPPLRAANRIPRHAFAAVDRFARKPREICRKHPKQSNTAW